MMKLEKHATDGSLNIWSLKMPSEVEMNLECDMIDEVLEDDLRNLNQRRTKK